MSQEDDIVTAIRQIIRAVDLHSRRLMSEHGLTGPQLATLREAARRKVVSAGDLAASAQIGQPTLTGILDRLERRGLIVRSREGADRRTVSVRVTPEGERALEGGASLLHGGFRQRLARLEPWERTQILGTLQRIAAMMADEAGRAEHAPSEGGSSMSGVDPGARASDPPADGLRPARPERDRVGAAQ